MKLFYKLVFIVALLTTCTEKSNDVVFKSFEFEIDDAIVSSEVVEYTVERIGIEFELKYCNEGKCVYYLIKDKSAKYTNESGDTFDMYFDREVDYKINGKVYRLKRYLMDKNAIDSEMQHYWSPEFGIFYTKSTAWGSFRILTKSVNGEEDLLNSLMTVLLRDESLMKDNDTEQFERDSLIDRMIEEELR